jgi:hypothetical protein
MTIEQFNSLVRLLPDLETALVQKGETVPRPHYSDVHPGRIDRSAAGANSAPAAADARDRFQKDAKRNIEATSGEEEDDGTE